MYTNEELSHKIKDIISNQLIVKEAEYPYAFTLQTGVSKKIEFPSKLSVFDIFTPNRTLDTTPVMLTLKTKNGYIIVTGDVTITEDDNLVITDIGQSEFTFNENTLHITNIEPLKKSVDHILTPEIFEVICVDNNDMGFTIYTGRVISLAYAKCVGRITISLPYSEMMTNRTLVEIIRGNIYAKEDIIDIIEKLSVFADTDK